MDAYFLHCTHGLRNVSSTFIQSMNVYSGNTPLRALGHWSWWKKRMHSIWIWPSRTLQSK